MGGTTGNRCPNCRAPLADRFCAHCGQQNRPRRVPIWKHVGQVAGAHLSLDSRIARTVPVFLFRPGLLTREYNDGRRVRYSSPLRTYLLMSLLLFVGLGITRFASDFVLIQTLVQTQGDAEEWLPAAPNGVGRIMDPATEAIEGLSRTISARPTQYEQRISETIVDLLGADHPICRFVVAKMARLEGMDWAEARMAGFDNWLNLLPTAMFLLLPFCAFLLKLFFLGADRYYVEHLVFTLHMHAFIYLVLLLLSVVWTPQMIAIGLAAIAVHVLIAMRTAYRASVLATLVRGPLFLVCYAALLAAGLGTTFWMSLMLI